MSFPCQKISKVIEKATIVDGLVAICKKMTAALLPHQVADLAQLKHVFWTLIALNAWIILFLHSSDNIILW